MKGSEIRIFLFEVEQRGSGNYFVIIWADTEEVARERIFNRVAPQKEHGQPSHTIYAPDERNGRSRILNVLELVEKKDFKIKNFSGNSIELVYISDRLPEIVNPDRQFFLDKNNPVDFRTGAFGGVNI